MISAALPNSMSCCLRAVVQSSFSEIGGPYYSWGGDASASSLSRSYWIPGSYAPLVSEKRNSFLRLLKNKAFKKERRTKNGVYAIGECTTLESNKSLRRLLLEPQDPGKRVDKWGNTTLALEPLVARDRGRSRPQRGAWPPAGLSGDGRSQSRCRQKIARRRDSQFP